MRLHELIQTYIQFKRSLGLRFDSDASHLRAFGRAMGEIGIEDVQPTAVLTFLAGTGKLTSTWHTKLSVLRNFYRYAIGRGLAGSCPLPSVIPKFPTQEPPYIYSIDELHRLLAATGTLQTPKSALQALTMRTLLLLLYGTGMRISEALSLTLRDANLEDSIVTVSDSKFYKSRLIPIGPKLTEALSVYLNHRRHLPLPAGESSALLATRTGNHLHYENALKLFIRVRKAANVQRDPSEGHQPCIHDVRHTSATHRVVAWYRAGADVQRLLPHLATYLGHRDLSGTQRYLSMTTELLQQAGQCFERYACQEVRHEG